MTNDDDDDYYGGVELVLVCINATRRERQEKSKVEDLFAHVMYKNETTTNDSYRPAIGKAASRNGNSVTLRVERERESLSCILFLLACLCIVCE